MKKPIRPELSKIIFFLSILTLLTLCWGLSNSNACTDSANLCKGDFDACIIAFNSCLSYCNSYYGGGTQAYANCLTSCYNTYGQNGTSCADQYNGCMQSCPWKITSIAGAGGCITSTGCGGSTSNCGTSSLLYLPGYAGSSNQQTYSIIPNSCYVIADVLVDGVSQGAISQYTFNNINQTTEYRTIQANFGYNCYSISATAGTGGSISPSGTVAVAKGSTQTFSISPNSCSYSIANVLIDGVAVGAKSTYTFLDVSSNHAIAASFVTYPYTITATAGSGGTITPTSATVPQCGSQIFTITPQTGFHIVDVVVEGVSKGPIMSYTFTNVSANQTITARFGLDADRIVPIINLLLN